MCLFDYMFIYLFIWKVDFLCYEIREKGSIIERGSKNKVIREDYDVKVLFEEMGNYLCGYLEYGIKIYVYIFLFG